MSKKDLKSIKLSRPLVKYERPKDKTKGKFTEVYLDPYFHTTGLITRQSGPSTLLGYCAEDPLEVLRTVFPDYHVTSFNGYSLFGSGDFEPSTPMLGLAMEPIDSVFGIEGRIEKLLELDELLKVKRKKPISREDVDRIIAHLEEEDQHSFLFSDHKQERYNKRQIINVIKQHRFF